MKSESVDKRISRLFRILGQPARLQILMAIGVEEACVCHLEAILSLRQAYISQHLMALREAGILETRRDGRFIYYRLKDPKTLDLIQFAAAISLEGQSEPLKINQVQYSADCVCPSCRPDA